MNILNPYMIDRLREGFYRLADRDKDVQAIVDDITARDVRLGTVVKVVVMAVVITGASVALFGTGSQGALAASISASDVSISTDDGNITRVTISPSGSVEWSGLDEEVDEVTVKFEIANESKSYHSVGGPNLDCTSEDHDWCHNTTGSATINATTFHLTNDSEYWVPGSNSPFDLSDFNASDGQTTNTTVHVKAKMILQNTNDDTILFTEEFASFEVQVTNEASSTSMSISLNTDATTPTA